MSRELEVVLSAVREASGLLVKEAERPDGPRGSGMKAPVDAEIGALICGRLEDAFPNDHIVCEEGGGKVGTSRRAFHIDPHDGTRDFLMGRRETSISVGLIDDGRCTLGVVFAPIAVPLFNDAPLMVSWEAGGVLCVDDVPLQPPPSPGQIEASHTLLISTRIKEERLAANRDCVAPAKLEHCASIATRFALVAIGRAEAAYSINHFIQTWDYAGCQALLQGAGGDVYDPLGQPIGWQGIEPVGPSLPGFYGARSAAYAGLVTKGIRPLIREDLSRS